MYKIFVTSFSLKDILIILFSFLGVFSASLYFLLINYAYVENVQLVFQMSALIIYILLGFNLSYIVYKFFTDSNKLIHFFVTLVSNNLISLFSKQIIFLNILSSLNLGLLIFTSLFDIKIVQIVLISLSLGIWPIIIIFLLSINGYYDVYFRTPKNLENLNGNKGIHNG